VDDNTIRDWSMKIEFHDALTVKHPKILSLVPRSLSFRTLCWFSIPNQDILSSLDEEKEKERKLMSFGHENSSWISWILISDTRDTKRCCCLLYQFNSTLKPRMCRNPTWVTFSNTVSISNSKLECLFSLKRGKRDLRVLNFNLSKMSPQVGLTVSRPWREPHRRYHNKTHSSRVWTSSLKIDEIDKSISWFRLRSRKNEISDISPGQKCVIHMEMSDSRISCTCNGARRSS